MLASIMLVFGFVVFADPAPIEVKPPKKPKKAVSVSKSLPSKEVQDQAVFATDSTKTPDTSPKPSVIKPVRAQREREQDTPMPTAPKPSASPDFLEDMPVGFRPPLDRYTPAQKKEVVQDLLRAAPQTVPFEIPQEDVQDMEAFWDKKDPENHTDLIRRVARAPRPISPPKAQPSNQTSSGTTPSISKPKANALDQEVIATTSLEVQHGTVHKDDLKGPAAWRRHELPAHMERMYEHVTVHELMPGENAGAAMYLSKSLLEKETQNTLKNLFRFPPDWNTRYKFDDDVVENAKKAQSFAQKSLLSLGKGGSLIIALRDGVIVNAEGPDFVLWENPFCFLQTPHDQDAVNENEAAAYPAYTPDSLRANEVFDQYVKCFTELARVSVSADPQGETFYPIEPCSRSGSSQTSKCSGYGLNVYQEGQMDVTRAGGDLFDLSDTPLEEVRAIMIEDLGFDGNQGAAGYDLDAFAIHHFRAD